MNDININHLESLMGSDRFDSFYDGLQRDFLDQIRYLSIEDSGGELVIAISVEGADQPIRKTFSAMDFLTGFTLAVNEGDIAHRKRVAGFLRTAADVMAPGEQEAGP
jgi:hypothetical protein